MLPPLPLVLFRRRNPFIYDFDSSGGGGAGLLVGGEGMSSNDMDGKEYLWEDEG